MVDDIQLLDLREDSGEATEQPANVETQTTLQPTISARTGIALLVLVGVLLVSIGLFGPSIAESSILWLFGGLRAFLGDSADSNGDKAGDAYTEMSDELSLKEVSGKQSDVTVEEEAAATRTRPEMSVTEPTGERDVGMLVETLMREGERQPLPDASGVVAPIRRPIAATLEGIPQELTVLRRDVGPVLVGVAYNETTVDRLAEVYDTMLVVSPQHEEALPEVLKYLPALVQTNGVSGLGSARTFTIPASEPPGPEAESQSTLKDLRGHKGEPLHPLARTEPDFLTVSAPPEWTGPARSVLSDYAPVIDIIEWDDDQIHVAGFVFDNAIDLPDHIVDHEQAAAGDEDPVAKGNEYPPRSGAGHNGSNAADRPEADGGTTQYGGAPDTDIGPDTSSSDADDGTEASSGSDSQGATLTPPNRDTPSDSDADTPVGAGGEPGASGTVGGGAGDDGGTAGAATVPDDTRGRPDNRSSTPSPAGGGDSDAPTQDADPSPESDHDSPTEQPSEQQNTSPDSQSGGSTDEDDSDADSGGAVTHPQPSSDESPATDTGVPGSDNDSAETPASPGNGGSGSSDDGGTLPPPGADVDFGADTGHGQTPTAGSSEQTSASGGSKPGQDDGSGSDAASQPTSERPSPTGDTPNSGDNGAGNGFEAGSSTSGAGSTPRAPDDEGQAPSAPPDPSYDTDDGPGIVPFGEAPASSDPTVVDVAEHVLNELAFQATATPNREVYSTVYADEDGLIRHHHVIDHPDFLESRQDSISFTPAFFEHLRLLANQRKDIDHRLAGGVHSHPVSGRPLQSPADKRFTRKIWRTQRNTAFVIGVKEGSGPDEWTITDDGYEAQRQSNEYIVRIRAFSGNTEPKQIRLHQDMGQ
ncbi:hypothetical protein [Haloarcula sp. Atlit-7R]|uniref:hypothetical protein n=1 Tax=Haloarcula sp. Atlit-7R TaxID=2282125 RepID=UPI000EF15C42|nr:hypothetical protein [Haloarcula sp. Atlit-7R]RLM90051.1 hypothetical protein D3D01_18325 [Haloarcula sp. Atlit-7R]